ncbi:diacylglycerol O-acyltransferase 1 [Entomophthora muscae]|uniref:Diacylglycerol O-acyltransferase 1 n=1 Tax=Entomophthora muscae TaxID=34485 RepID=A0ACC2USV8_9FUNG|nr:diacylglycerol O-acyltransferase 1 [Entomophthora muscae]
MTPKKEFSSPLYREILLSSKMATNTNSTILRILQHGHSCLIPTNDHPSSIAPDLLEIASITGASLVPVYGFRKDSTVHPPTKFEEVMGILGMPTPCFYGQEGRPSLASLPEDRKAINVIVGEPTPSSVSQINQDTEKLQHSYFLNATALHLKYKHLT